MRTDTQTVTYGGARSPTVLDGYGFRIRPSDGVASFPRMVQLDGGRSYKVDGPGWVPTKARTLDIIAADPPAPVVLNSASASEQWDVTIAESECEAQGAVDAKLPARQLLWSIDDLLPVGIKTGPVVDATPFDAYRFVVAGAGNISAIALNPIEAGDKAFPVGAFGAGQQILCSGTGGNGCDFYVSRRSTDLINNPTTGLTADGLPFDLFRPAIQVATAPTTVHARLYGIRFPR